MGGNVLETHPHPTLPLKGRGLFVCCPPYPPLEGEGPGYLGENGCLTELRLATTSAGCGSPFNARSIDSLTAW
jgi:hypothetical protein